MNKALKYIGFSGLLMAGLAACSPVKILNAVTPSGAFELQKDISYGELPRHALDVYAAVNAKAEGPVLLFVHGGGWTRGDKNIYKFIGQNFSAAGYNVVIPNYRLYPEVRFPDFIQDAAEAVAWTHARYPDRKIVLMGHSAGAHTVLNLAMNDRYLSEVKVDRCAVVAGTIGLAGPYGEAAFTDEPYITIFPERNLGDDAPLYFADKASPPLLLLTGAEDKTVHPANSSLLAKRVTEHGGQATAKSYPGLGHIDIVKVLSKFFDGDATVKPDMLNFIEALSLDEDNACRR